MSDTMFVMNAAAELPAVQWRKSSYSGKLGNSVELAQLPDGAVAMRNSREPDGPALIFTPADIAAFVRSAKEREFDDLA